MKRNSVTQPVPGDRLESRIPFGLGVVHAGQSFAIDNLVDVRHDTPSSCCQQSTCSFVVLLTRAVKNSNGSILWSHLPNSEIEPDHSSAACFNSIHEHVPEWLDDYLLFAKTQQQRFDLSHSGP